MKLSLLLVATCALTAVAHADVIIPTATVQNYGTAFVPTVAAGSYDFTTFKNDVAAAYTANNGGVIGFDDVSSNITLATKVTATYGITHAASIDLTYNGTDATQQGWLQAGTASSDTPLSAPNQMSKAGGGNNEFDFAFSTPLSEFGLVMLDRIVTGNVPNGTNTTVTIIYDNATQSALTSHLDNVGTGGTFFGFQAPAGRTITGVKITNDSNNQYYQRIDDIGFVTAAPEPGTLALLGLGALSLLRPRRR